MTILGISHFGLCVTDLDAALRFYCDALGFRVLRTSTTTSSSVAQQDVSNARFAFVLDPDGNRVELFGMIDETGRKPWEFAP